jgi:tetratricopeptide (TPR) repeat protein
MNFKEAAKYYFSAQHLRQSLGYLNEASKHQTKAFQTELYYHNSSVDNVFLQVMKLHEQKKYSEAITILNRLVKDYPDYAAAYFFRGSCYAYLNDYVNAEKDYIKATSLQNWSGNFYYELAIAQKNLEKYNEAYNNFKKAEELYTSNYLYAHAGDSLDNMARLKQQSKEGLNEIQRLLEESFKAEESKDYKTITKNSEKLIKLAPDLSIGYTLRAETCLANPTCLADLDKAICLNKYDSTNYSLKGAYYRNSNKISDAKHMFKQAALMAFFNGKNDYGNGLLKQAIEIKFPEPKFNLFESLIAATGANNDKK